MGDPSLPGLGVQSPITVSGLSSGAFMAVQYHVSHSQSTSGVASFAGGPFWCAKDNVETALHACMVTPANIDPTVLGTFTQRAADVLSIDRLSNLKDAKVFIYSGSNDTVVVPGVAPKLAQYYRQFVTPPENIKEVLNISSEHAMPTDNGFGNACGYKGTPYINNCGYDGAFNALDFLVGPGLVKAVPNQSKRQNLVSFDQTSFFATGLPRAIGMDIKGYVYVPDRCKAAGSRCKLHVVYHGCLQGAYLLDDTFAWNAGFNPHAEANGIVILYPQAYQIPELNPKGCWDWWGYAGPDYACALGSQVAAVNRMVKALQRAPPSGAKGEFSAAVELE